MLHRLESASHKSHVDMNQACAQKAHHLFPESLLLEGLLLGSSCRNLLLVLCLNLLSLPLLLLNSFLLVRETADTQDSCELPICPGLRAVCHGLCRQEQVKGSSDTSSSRAASLVLDIVLCLEKTRSGDVLSRQFKQIWCEMETAPFVRSKLPCAFQLGKLPAGKDPPAPRLQPSAGQTACLTSRDLGGGWDWLPCANVLDRLQPGDRRASWASVHQAASPQDKESAHPTRHALWLLQHDCEEHATDATRC